MVPVLGGTHSAYGAVFFLFLFFFFPFLPQSRQSISPSIDRRLSKSTVDSRFPLNRSSTVDFWRYRPVAASPRIGNLAARYVPSGRYERYIPIRQVSGTRIARYQAIPPKIGSWRSISARLLVVAARGSWALFLPREETERLPAQGERSRRQEEEKKKKEEEKKYLAHAPSLLAETFLPMRPRRPWVAASVVALAAHGSQRLRATYLPARGEIEATTDKMSVHRPAIDSVSLSIDSVSCVIGSGYGHRAVQCTSHMPLPSDIDLCKCSFPKVADQVSLAVSSDSMICYHGVFFSISCCPDEAKGKIDASEAAPRKDVLQDANLQFAPRDVSKIVLTKLFPTILQEIVVCQR
ncbi:hypothetical protein GW17_00040342 [Ensete ventricosum]|nr:hypothetical protein GW17_00040342 [Ensete ventricosum]